MQDTEIRDLVLKHEHSIETLAESISKLADSATTTNRKIDDVVSALNAQNILAERMANMQSNNKAINDSVFERLRVIESAQTTTGCPQLNILKEKYNGVEIRFDAEIKSLHEQINDIELGIKEDKQSKWKVWVAIIGVAAAAIVEHLFGGKA